MNDHPTVSHPMIKIVSVWLAAFGIASWSELAAALAALYSVLLIGEWLWKKIGRPFAEHHGLLARKARRASDRD